MERNLTLWGKVSMATYNVKVYVHVHVHVNIHMCVYMYMSYICYVECAYTNTGVLASNHFTLITPYTSLHVCAEHIYTYMYIHVHVCVCSARFLNQLR